MVSKKYNYGHNFLTLKCAILFLSKRCMKVRNSVGVVVLGIIFGSVFVGFKALPATAQDVGGRNASCVALEVPSQVLSGKIFEASVVMKNTGSVAWRSNENYTLGSANNFWWGLSRAALPSIINSNQDSRFTFTATAPLATGNYVFSWKMLQEGVTWFGDICTKTIAVVSSANNAQVVSVDVPTSLGAGQNFTATVTMRNNSFIPWTKQDQYKLGSETPKDNVRWGHGRVEVTETIQSNQEKKFTIEAIAPTTPGVYKFDWRMLQEGKEWFGALATANVTVTAPLNNAEFVSIAVPERVKTGEKFTATVVMKNTGTQTWKKTEPNAYRLGSQTPPDNLLWGFGRMNLAADVPTGSNATFTAEFTAPATAGTYTFDWKMLKEGMEWFGPLVSRSILVESVATPTPTPTPPQPYTTSSTFPYGGQQAFVALIAPQMGSIFAAVQNVAVQMNITMPSNESLQCGDWYLETADGTRVTLEWMNNQAPTNLPSCTPNPY